MLSRYKIYRGKRPTSEPLPKGDRKDTRKHTKHCMRPTSQIVASYLDDPTDQSWRAFEKAYRTVLNERFARDRTPFDELAARSRRTDVFLGCNCPTKKNPNVHRCHTVLALRFMKQKFPRIKVAIPARS